MKKYTVAVLWFTKDFKKYLLTSHIVDANSPEEAFGIAYYNDKENSKYDNYRIDAKIITEISE